MLHIKRMFSSLTLAASVLFGGSAVAQSAIELPTRLVFSRAIVDEKPVDRIFSTYSWGEQEMPPHLMANPGHSFLFHVFSTPRPEGAKTQFVVAKMRSRNLFAANPDAHLFVGARAESTAWYNRGRGFIVGWLGTTANPCGSGIRSQPETWFIHPESKKASNYVWGNPYCGDEMQENKWYDIELHVDSSNNFAYSIKNNGFKVGGGFGIHDNKNPDGEMISSQLSGFSLGLVFAGNYKAPFSLEFNDIKVGWF